MMMVSLYHSDISSSSASAETDEAMGLALELRGRTMVSAAEFEAFLPESKAFLPVASASRKASLLAARANIASVAGWSRASRDLRTGVIFLNFGDLDRCHLVAMTPVVLGGAGSAAELALSSGSCFTSTGESGKLSGLSTSRSVMPAATARSTRKK
jgi:hypothetical protein